jgi:hypothetical protein
MLWTGCVHCGGERHGRRSFFASGRSASPSRSREGYRPAPRSLERGDRYAYKHHRHGSGNSLSMATKNAARDSHCCAWHASGAEQLRYAESPPLRGLRRLSCPMMLGLVEF